jgi:7-cyano-7-deazaguanine synthase
MTASLEKAVVLLSGGLDSSVLIHYAARTLAVPEIHAISFRYGQRHARELDCARYQAEAADAAAHRVLDISFLGELLAPGSALISGGAPVPGLDSLDEETRQHPPTYVPNRNMMLLAMAAAYAEARGIADVFYGAQAQDEYGYWDCTTDFLDRINAALALNRGTPVTIHAPFIHHSKAGNVRIGLELGVDFAHTWSCYRGQDTPCGACPTCVERANAFQANNTPDPAMPA